MSEYTPYELTGLTLDEYAREMGKTVEELIEEKEREIRIYKRRYDELVANRQNMPIALLAKEVNGIVHKKRVKLEEFKRWKRSGKR